MNRHLRALTKAFALLITAIITSGIVILLLNSFGAWFPLSVAIAIVFYGVYRLCLDED